MILRRSLIFTVIQLLFLYPLCLTAQVDTAGTIKNRERIPEGIYKEISIHLKEVSLKEALIEISSKCDVVLNYTDDFLPLEKNVSINMDDTPAIEALMKVLNETGTGLIVTASSQLIIVPIEEKRGTIEGTVIDKETKEPLWGVNILVSGTHIGSSSDKEGNFIIPGLTPGIYFLEVSMIGYEKEIIEQVVVNDKETVKIRIELGEKVLSISEIIVTPGRFSIMEREPVTRSALREEHIRTFPQLGEDIYRAVQRLPGLSGNDFSARFTVRGGEHYEVLVMLDGMELYDPFHMKDLDGFTSIVDVEAIRSIDMMTGAFPVNYGDRMSGVFNMKTVTPNGGKNKTSLAVSFMNARLKSQGSFANGNGKWLVVARRGYLDLLLDVVEADGDFKPFYYDILGKAQYFLSEKHSIAVNLLTADDDLSVDVDDADIITKHGNHYGWFTWNAQYRPKLFAQTILYTGKVSMDAKVDKEPELGSDFLGSAHDTRGFDFIGAKQDWSLEVNDKYLVKMGFNSKRFNENYSFEFLQEFPTGIDEEEVIYDYDTTNTDGVHSGNQLGVYLSNRFRPVKPLTVEVGFRYDQSSWNDDENFSPRINVSYDFNKRTSLRLGWGKFYQSQMIGDHHEQDGETRYYPAELATHYVAGIEHTFPNNVNFRIEAYKKDITNMRPYYFNFRGSSLNPFAEIHGDRIKIQPDKGESKGLELYLSNDTGRKFNWWLSYSISFAENYVDGAKIPKLFDQRHTIFLDLTYTPNSKWRFNTSWNFHSGWPYTVENAHITRWLDEYTYDFAVEPGPLMAERFPAYHRMDFRASRIYRTDRGIISAFLELRNVYLRENVREYDIDHYFINGSLQAVQDEAEAWLPPMPSFGVSWEF